MISLFFNFVVATMLTGSINISNDPHGAIGIRIGMNHVITRVYNNTPAERAGLLPGDKVLSVIDEESKRDIAGPTGSQVHLSVRRGDETLTFDIERAAESSIVRK